MTRNPLGDPMKSEDEIKQQALIDNTAQGIFNHLKEIENKREIYERRWIWELLQNALDAAQQDRKIKVEIIGDNNRIVFRHNGRPFKPEEVAHLIYHGSTKKETDIGRFGTGFLTTHLLSRNIKVKGIRIDNKKFEFDLDRGGESSDDIAKLMEKTWEQYKNSLYGIEKAPNYSAEYEYHLNNISTSTVKAGIDELARIAPYVLAFNDKLGVIEIKAQEHDTKFELVSETKETKCVHKVVREEQKAANKILHELLILKDKADNVEIAIKGKCLGDKTWQIESLQSNPKIFLAFPLFGTQDLPFPAIVNSRQFEPTEKRDGIYLGREDTPLIKKNKGLLETASELFIELLSHSKPFENIHNLLNLCRPPKIEWLDQDWFSSLLKKLIIEIVKSNVLKTQSGNFIAPEKAFVPVVEKLENERAKELWDLCYLFLDYKELIPTKELTIEWAQIFSGWNSLGLDLTKQQITIEGIASEIDKCKNLQTFKAKLSDDKDELAVLNDFYRLLLQSDKRKLFDDKCILPNQNSNFCKKQELYKDEDIDETLKEISQQVGVDVRNKLLHPMISKEVQELLSTKNQEEVLDQVATKIKQPLPGNAQYLHANILLFDWLIEHNKFEYLEGYPVLSLKEKTFILLNKQSKEKPLAPKEVWKESARIYADLFPQDYLISSLYFEKILHKEKWSKLEDLTFIITDPLYKEAENVNRDDLEYMLSLDETLGDDDKEHDIIGELNLSKIAFLDLKDKGVIATVRRSKDKARKFLGFLIDYILENDVQWVNTVECDCKCKSKPKHKIYTALWLGRLRNREWVPTGKGREEKPSASVLASLIGSDKNLLGKFRQEKPSLLLGRLNISISELMMNVAAKDNKTKSELDKAMGSLFSTYMTNPSQLSKIAQLAESEPVLFINEIEERIKTEEQIHKNQSVGALVENLLKKVLENEGFKVERTGIGSDFIVEHDFIENGVETIFQIKKDQKIHFLIEVKATTQNFARMTLPQAKTARDNSNKYALCVVQLNSEEITEEIVRGHAKFVTDIGQKILEKVNKVESMKIEQRAISETGDIEIEINEGPVRFKIYAGIWDSSKTADQFLELIRVSKHE